MVVVPMVVRRDLRTLREILLGHAGTAHALRFEDSKRFIHNCDMKEKYRENELKNMHPYFTSPLLFCICLTLSP